MILYYEVITLFQIVYFLRNYKLNSFFLIEYSGIQMKGLTHVFFGIGFVSILLSFTKVPLLFWGIGTLIIAPFFSRVPDYDQKIAKVTFNRVVPHRGKATHNLLYGLPLFSVPYIIEIPILGVLLTTIIVSIFGALFSHTFVDAFNFGGVWCGIFKIKGFLEWDSFWGNFSFKLIGFFLFLISIGSSIFNYY